MPPLLLALALAAPPGLHAVPRTAALSVDFPPGLRLNRAAPNRLTLRHPWGSLALAPLGTPDPRDPAHLLTGLQRLWFRVRVPPGTQAGSYPARLSAEFYLCDGRLGQCFRKALTVPATLSVGPAARPTGLTLTRQELRP